MGSNPISSEMMIFSLKLSLEKIFDDQQLLINSIFSFQIFGGIVQLVERMLCKHEVNGSSPFTSIRQKKLK